MAEDEKHIRPFENTSPGEEFQDETRPRKIRRRPFEIDYEEGQMIPERQSFDIIHGNVFDEEPVLTPEQGQMILKRLRDEGYMP